MGMFSADENGWVTKEELEREKDTEYLRGLRDCFDTFKSVNKEETFEFIEKNGDEILVKHTPLPEYGYGIQQVTNIITKKAFLECYNRWIKDNN